VLFLKFQSWLQSERPSSQPPTTLYGQYTLPSETTSYHVAGDAQVTGHYGNSGRQRVQRNRTVLVHRLSVSDNAFEWEVAPHLIDHSRWLVVMNKVSIDWS